MASGVLKVKVELGNEAMSTRSDLADALEGVARGIDAGNLTGGILDANGNTVGRWTIDGEVDDE